MTDPQSFRSWKRNSSPGANGVHCSGQWPPERRESATSWKRHEQAIVLTNLLYLLISCDDVANISQYDRASIQQPRLKPNTKHLALCLKGTRYMLQSLTRNSTKGKTCFITEKSMYIGCYSLINCVDHANEKCLLEQIFIKTINFHSFFLFFIPVSVTVLQSRLFTICYQIVVA